MRRGVPIDEDFGHLLPVGGGPPPRRATRKRTRGHILDITDHLRACADDPQRRSVVAREVAP